MSSPARGRAFCRRSRTCVGHRRSRAFWTYLKYMYWITAGKRSATATAAVRYSRALSVRGGRAQQRGGDDQPVFFITGTAARDPATSSASLVTTSSPARPRRAPRGPRARRNLTARAAHCEHMLHAHASSLLCSTTEYKLYACAAAHATSRREATASDCISPCRPTTVRRTQWPLEAAARDKCTDTAQ